MKKVLISGAHSYIGTSFQRWAEKRYPGEFNIDTLDVRESSWKTVSFRGYDAVLHVAGLVHQNEKKIEEAEYDRVNHLLTVEVAQKAKSEGVRHFVFMSTKGVYAPNTPMICKDTPPDPKKKYGRSKLAAERDLLTMANTVFCVSILRPPTVYGEGCRGNFQKLEKLSRKIHVFPDKDNERSMIYIYNLCEFLCLVLLSPPEERILLPQNREYAGTLRLMKAIWEARGETYRLSKVLSCLVGLLMRMNKLKTAFSDSCYDLAETGYYNGEYQVYSLKESIEQCETSCKGKTVWRK